jgi:hypothetical protein
MAVQNTYERLPCGMRHGHYVVEMGLDFRGRTEIEAACISEIFSWESVLEGVVTVSQFVAGLLGRLWTLRAKAIAYFGYLSVIWRES